MSLSVALHALLFLWIVLRPAAKHEAPMITEIMVLDPSELLGAPAVASPAVSAAEPRSGAAARNVAEARFERMHRTGDISLDPTAPVISDQLEARLATLQKASVLSPAGTGTAPAPAALFGSGGAPMGGTGGGPAIALTRGGGGGSPLPLTRGGAGGAGLAPSTLPATKTGAGGGTAAPAQVGDAAARRTVAGASLAGPIADRKVLSTVVPEYPEWAKREAVEGSVTLYFVVRPDGTVKENVVIQKTAGFGEFDDNARTALRAWRFEPLHGGRTGEQWGTITFHFRLRDAG
jgi:TonB family protein